MKSAPQVIIGLLGTVLDEGHETSRWESWRPTVSLCQHEEFLVDRLELLYQKSAAKLMKRVVDDIALVSPETTVCPIEVTMKDPWDFEEVYGVLLDFSRHYTFKPEEEHYFVHITTGTHVAQICLFLLTESRHIPAKLIQTSPPDRRPSPVPGKYAIIDLDLSKYDRIAARYQREQKDARSFLKSGIETRNPFFNELIERLEHVAIHTKAPILLMGPTGAGKSQLAKRICELKRAKHQISGPFLEVNCATIRGDSAMSTLFGHVKGSFTGAMKDRPGLLRSANGGILFLDEIGEMGMDEQTMLLRALEEKRFLPLGSDQEVSSEFQLIAGTNRDLVADVHKGRFREDLFARINLWTFRIPGLAERPEDLEPNLDFELDQYAQKNSTRVTMSTEVRERFLSFAQSSRAKWKANFRDLNAAITRMATLAPGGRITLDILQEEISRLLLSWKSEETMEDSRQVLHSLLGEEKMVHIDLFDQIQLAQVVAKCRQCASLSEAGRILYSVSRNEKKQPNDADRLRKYLARFDLEWKDIF